MPRKISPAPGLSALGARGNKTQSVAESGYSATIFMALALELGAEEGMMSVSHGCPRDAPMELDPSASVLAACSAIALLAEGFTART